VQLGTDAQLLETHRVTRTGYRYRMLDSAFDAAPSSTS
jgi:hypothetical protein